MKRLLFGLGLISLLALSSCTKKEVSASGDIIEREFEIKEASKLSVYDIYTKFRGTQTGSSLSLIPGSEKKIIIKTNESVFDELSVTYSGDTLKIHGDKNEVYLTQFVDIRIEGYTFEEINLCTVEAGIDDKCLTNADLDLNFSGASNVSVDNIDVNELDMDVSGASQVYCANIYSKDLDMDISGASQVQSVGIYTNEFDIELSGASKLDSILEATKGEIIETGASCVEMSGSVSELKLDESGASSFDGYTLTVKALDVSLSGASTLKIGVSEVIKGSASGASDIKYIGNGTSNVSLSGASTIKKE